MHRSRVGVVLIDHPDESYDRAEAFWAAAMGTPAERSGSYASVGRAGGLRLELQRTGTGTAPRVHLDVETDDVPAEVKRLESAGATVVERREGYAIMQDPGGVVFCVVPAWTGDDFDTNAVERE